MLRLLSVPLAAAVLVTGQIAPATSTPPSQVTGRATAETPRTDPGPGDFATVPMRRPGQSDHSIVAYWTPDRLRRALPAGARGPHNPKHQIKRPGSQIITRGTPVAGASAGRGVVVLAYADPDTPRIPHAAAALAVPPPSIGRVYFSTPAGDNYCSASAVSAPQGNLVVTAAHCVGSSGTISSSAVFIPRYYAGAANSALGLFPVYNATMKTPFSGGSTAGAADDRYDYAFLRVGPSSVSRKTVQAATGGALLLASPQLSTRTIQGWGYNYGETSPRTCTVASPVVTKYLSGVGNYPFRALGCNPFSAGVSGGPFYLASGPQVPQGWHPPILAGNVGGWVGGGWDDATSYSVVYREDTLNAYLKAAGLPGAAQSSRTSFSTAVAVAAGNFTRSFPARRDIYTVWSDGSVSVQLGTADAGAPFGLGVRLAGPDSQRATATSASAGDIDRDGVDDLVVRLGSGRVLLYPGVSRSGIGTPRVMMDGTGWWAGATQVQVGNLDRGTYADDLLVTWTSGPQAGRVSRYLNYQVSGFTAGASYAYPGTPRTAGITAMAFAELSGSAPNLVVRHRDGRVVTYQDIAYYGIGRPTTVLGASTAGAAVRAMTAANVNYLSLRRDDLLSVSTSGGTVCFGTSLSAIGSCGPRQAQY